MSGKFPPVHLTKRSIFSVQILIHAIFKSCWDMAVRVVCYGRCMTWDDILNIDWYWGIQGVLWWCFEFWMDGLYPTYISMNGYWICHFFWHQWKLSSLFFFLQLLNLNICFKIWLPETFLNTFHILHFNRKQPNLKILEPFQSTEKTY